MQLTDEINQRIAALKTIGLFAEIDDVVLVELVKSFKTKSIKKDEVLFSKGDKDYTLYFVTKGRVKAHVGEHVYAIFGASQYFGEYSLIDSSPRSTTVTAIESTHLLYLENTVFNSLVVKYPSINQSMLKGLVWRLRDYNILEAELTTKNREIKKQKEELEVQRKELESLNSTKDKFFAIIAHDLKNPFSTVLGLSELLAKEFESFEPEKLKIFIQQIYKYSNNTYNLLENLLQWSMLQTGRMPLKPKIINISDLVSENIELLKGNAVQKAIRIYTSNIDDRFAYADPNMITTVVRNLLSNAIKFTQVGGEVKIIVQGENEFWKVLVMDNGVGISNFDKAKLFQLDANHTTIGTLQEKGTGLGLILCKEFVERNGGVISVESEIGKGTTFAFTVPKVGNGNINNGLK